MHFDEGAGTDTLPVVRQNKQSNQSNFVQYSILQTLEKWRILKA